VSTLCTRACLFAFAAALSVSTGVGQPPTDKKAAPKPQEPPGPYTAFPDLKAPTTERAEVTNPDGTTRIVLVEKNTITLPPWPKVAADAPPLRKLLFEQMKEGRDYLDKINEVIRLGAYDMRLLREYAVMTVDVYGLAAELEEQPAKRVPWFEARVRKLKELEQLVDLGVRAGSEPSRSTNLARFQRLQAEVDLIKLKAEVEKAGKK
jgi:hypothetical protein